MLLIPSLFYSQKIEKIGSKDFKLTHSHTSSVSGIKHEYFIEVIQGKEVLNSLYSRHSSAEKAVVHFNDQSQPIKDKFADFAYTNLKQALLKVADHLEIGVLPFNIESTNSIEQKILLPDLSKDTITVKKSYLVSEKKLIPVWQIIIQTETDWWDMRLNAITLEVIEKINWVSHCNFDVDHSSCEHHSHDMKSATYFVPNSYNVFPLGLESPIHGSRALQVNPYNNLASPYGWHDTNGAAGAEHTTTKGNNVEAKEDKAGNNETTIGAFAEGGVNLEFDFPLNLTLPPVDNQNASLSNLFYWNNIIHDVYYQHGFTEAAGNFQTNNYGKGGLGNDFVFADGLDGSGTNNANFGTPVDGLSPRMQMFLWNKNNFSITAPSNIAGTVTAAKAQFGPQVYSLVNQVALVDPIDGCTAPFNNPAAIAGKIAMIDRGNCEFGTKCLNAQNAGAVAVIVCNNVSGNPIAMPPGSNGPSVTIPCVMFSQATCNSIKAELNNNVVVSVNLTSKQIDGSFDNLIIAHEYGHGISNRLTGGAANSSCLGNQEQMGEGWSDWLGLMITMDANDTDTMGRGIGNYVTTENVNGNGIRPFKYSTSMVTNPHTYNSIKTAAVPHGVGSVWCAMLWEITWAMINQYGYSNDFYNGNGGNNRAMKLVLEGMKLQPCNPGFVDGRDAILRADEIMYGGENKCLIWKAFAKRGLGIGAIQGSSGSIADGTENFDVPIDCNSIQLSKTTPDLFAIPGDSVSYKIKIKNISQNTFTNVVIKDTLDSRLILLSAPLATVNGQALQYNKPTLASGDSSEYTIVSKLNSSASTQLINLTDNAETADTSFISINTNTLAQSWQRTTSTPINGIKSWFASNNSTPVEKYLVTKSAIYIEDSSKLNFTHNFNTELNWDGGLVQISTDNQKTWQDLGPHMIQDGYNDFIDDIPANQAFSGNSNGNFTTIVNLQPFAHKLAHIRFWFHCDAAVGGVGWKIDDISINKLRPTLQNVVYQANDENKNSSTKLKHPSIIFPCRYFYNKYNDGEGSMRKAILCSQPNDTIAPVLLSGIDTIKLQSTISLPHHLSLINHGSNYLNIKMDLANPIFSITNNSNFVIKNLKLIRSNSINYSPLILLQPGNLTIDDCDLLSTNNGTSKITTSASSTITVRQKVNLKQ